MTETGQTLETVRISIDPEYLLHPQRVRQMHVGTRVAPEVVLEAEKCREVRPRFTVPTSRGAAQEGAASGAAPRPAAKSGAGS